MKADIGIAEDHATKVAHILNQLLADENLLYVKTRNYHWNVKGIHFHSLHKFFEGQYDELAEIIDEVAERVRQLNHLALGTMVEFMEHSQFTEEPAKHIKADKMVENLLEDHELVIRTIRDNISRVGDDFLDAGNADKLTAWMQAHEQMAWILRSHLQ